DNQVVLSVDKDGYATSYTYDSNGNVVSRTLYATALSLPVNPSVQPSPVTSANDRTTGFAYDRLNRLVSQTDGAGNRISETQYNQPVTATTGSAPPQPAVGDAGPTTLFGYDADNRLIQQT